MIGIIFDFNGTLFWDTELHYKAWREYSKQLRGTPFSDEEMYEHMSGRTNYDILKYCLNKEPEPEFCKKLSYEKEAMYRKTCLKNRELLKLAPGAEEFLDFLKENNIPRTIATMSEIENVEFYIKEFQLEKWFDIDEIVYNDNKIKGKPHPEIYQIAASRLNLKPENCVVFEDAISGIQSAFGANIGKVIAVASQEKVETYQSINGLYQIITDFYQIDKKIFQ